MDKLFQAYKRMLELHIATKTTSVTFHETSAKFYELLFDVFHTISEKNQDLEKEVAMDCKEASEEAYKLLEEAKSEIETMIKEDNSFWMDNLLRWLFDKLEFSCGTARSFLEKDDEKPEDKEEEEWTKEEKPKKVPMPIKK